MFYSSLFIKLIKTNPIIHNKYINIHDVHSTKANHNAHAWEIPLTHLEA